MKVPREMSEADEMENSLEKRGGKMPVAIESQRGANDREGTPGGGGRKATGEKKEPTTERAHPEAAGGRPRIGREGANDREGTP